MHGSKALRFGIRLFSASTAFLLWLCCSALRTAPNDLHALPPSLERLAGAVTVCGSEASFRSGSFLALDCKAFSMHGSKALRFGIRLFSASTAFLLWLCCSALRTAPNDLHALPPSLQRRPAGAATVLASEASVRSGSFLALDCKAFSMHGSKALRFGIRLFSASTAFLLWLCCSALRTAPNDLHVVSFAQRRPAGAATALLRKKQQAAGLGPYGYSSAQRYGNSGPETGWADGKACLGPQRARRQLTAMKQLNGAARLAASLREGQAGRVVFGQRPGQAAMGCNAAASPETPG